MHYRDDPKEVAQSMQSPSQIDTFNGKINKSKGKSLQTSRIVLSYFLLLWYFSVYKCATRWEIILDL